MKNSDALYEEKVVQALRGMESRTIKKWEQDGWELVGRDEGKLRTALTFRKRKLGFLNKNGLIFAGAGAVAVVGLIGLTVFGGGDSSEETVGTAADSAEQTTTNEETSVPTEGSDSDELITADSHPDFAALLQEPDYCGAPVADFADQYSGRSIQFDGHIATMDATGANSTRYNLLLSPGDSTPEGNSSGPTFSYRDINPSLGLKFVDGNAPDPLAVGQNLKFTAELGKFDEGSCLFIIEPIKTEVRDVVPPVLEEEDIPEESVPQELAVIPEEAPAPAPAPVPAPAPAPIPAPASANYGSCSDVRAAGAAPIYQGQPGYSRKLDRDGDGVACE